MDNARASPVSATGDRLLRRRWQIAKGQAYVAQAPRQLGNLAAKPHSFCNALKTMCFTSG